MTLPPATPGRLSLNLLHFARLLRRTGLPVGPADMLAAQQAITLVDLASRAQVRTALRASMIHRHEHADLFDHAFSLFWRDPEAGKAAAALGLLAGPPTPPERAPPGARRLAEAMQPDREQPPKPPEQRQEIDASFTVSANERLQTMDFEAMSADEIAAAKREIRKLTLPLDARRTRRRRPDPTGPHVDLRATIRQSLRHGGEIFDIAASRKVTRPPPLVVLCDISGSMSRYAQILLHFLHAVANDRDRVATFLFGTRLSNVTRQLRHRDPEVAFEMVAASVPDWSGGTRIGEALAAFNRNWARRVLGQGAVVLLVTDGLDREGARGPRREHGAAAQILLTADMAQSAVALGRLRAKIARRPGDAAARGRVPPGTQPRQPAGAGRDPVAPGAARGDATMEARRMSMTEAEDVLSAAAVWRAAGERVAVATVTETWGSSPRPAGSQMAVTASGRMAGSVSGGCIEGAVAEAARKTIETGVPQLLDFGVTNERAWEVGLACGGKVKVFVEALT